MPKSCPAYPFPASTNATLGTGLAQMLSTSLIVEISPMMMKNSDYLSSLYCASDSAQQCFGICPNADLAGVGVRAAFWISSILQAVLVALSPQDSTQGAWSAAILTASVTIPAFIQKRQQQLSIYHATLVLNFATFSSVVSLAVAPMCAIWRLHWELEDRRSPLPHDLDDFPENEVAIFGEEGQPVREHSYRPLSNLPKRKVHRQRLILSLALLTQVALQWTWAVILFTDPNYVQKSCSPDTIVLLFGAPFSVSKINHGLFFLWPIWLLFNVGLTLFWGVLLVYTSSSSVHPVLSRQTSNTGITTMTRWPSFPVDMGRIIVLAGNIMAFLVSVLFLVSSEIQVSKNCVLGGENTSWGFGQVAALLVALAPAWSIFVAIEKMRSNSSRDVNAEDSFRTERGRVSPPPTPSDGTKTPVEELYKLTYERRSFNDRSQHAQFLVVP